MNIIQRNTSELIAYVNNARTHSDAQIDQLAASIKEFGFCNPVLIDSNSGIIAGHGRVQAAKKLGLDTVPTIELSHLSDAQRKAYILADNRLAEKSGWDDELLRLELGALNDLGFDLGLIGFDDFDLSLGDDSGAGGDENNDNPNLSDRFMIPPFSVLNAREGWWQNRKRAWLAIGIKSELGRDNESIGYSDACKKGYAKSYTGQDSLNQIKNNKSSALDTGTSIFDPVLCEIVYRWFSPANGLVLDPFAGGSVRGIVASKTERQYIGHELRYEQVQANKQQGDELCRDAQYPPTWICGDSRNIDKTCHDAHADLVFSCPPYADLEVYSDNAQDLSTLPYNDFIAAYREIIAKSCALLKQDAFACFVVGEVRDNKGNYYNFVGDTITAFIDAGMNYYNEVILVTSVGSLPIRAGRQFSSGRKIGKTHQNILVFVKGDGKKAAERCGIVEIDDALFDGISDDESVNA